MVNPESEIELDSRMTDECRIYVEKVFKTLKPTDSIKIDINFLRKSKDLLSDEAIKIVNFDQLDITEFIVKSNKDTVDIQVT